MIKLKSNIPLLLISLLTIQSAIQTSSYKTIAKKCIPTAFALTTLGLLAKNHYNTTDYISQLEKFTDVMEDPENAGFKQDLTVFHNNFQKIKNDIVGPDSTVDLALSTNPNIEACCFSLNKKQHRIVISHNYANNIINNKQQQCLATLAHELSHAKYNDTKTSIISNALGYSLVGYITGKILINPHLNKLTRAIITPLTFMALNATYGIGQAYLVRRPRETRADLTATRYGHGRALIENFQRLQNLELKAKAIEKEYLANENTPLAHKIMMPLDSYFNSLSHPPLEKRITAIEKEMECIKSNNNI